MTQLISTILPGVGGMANVHPLFVHFPIALLNAFLLMELLGVLLKKEGLREAAPWMLYLGTLGAVATVATGLRAASTVPHIDAVHDMMQTHRNLGLTVLALAVILSVWRLAARAQFSRGLQALHLVMALVMVGAMALGADKGGQMVYEHGVAVEAVPRPEKGGHGHGRGNGHHGAERETMDMETNDKAQGHHDGEKNNPDGHHHKEGPGGTAPHEH